MKIHLEFWHLRTVKIIHEVGGLAKAADILYHTVSVKPSSQRTGGSVRCCFVLRRTKPMRLTAAGLRFLRLAEKILPEIDAVQAEFSSLRDGRVARLHIAI